MKSGIITCPQCGHEIEITAAIADQLRNGMQLELKREIARRQQELDQQNEALKQQADALKQRRQNLDDEVKNELQARLEAETAKLGQLADQKARAAMAVTMADMQAQINEKAAALESARVQELDLRKKAREIEEQKQAMDLELARKLDAERKKITQDTQKQFLENHALKDREKDQRIADLIEALETAQRKAQQGSMERQGEAAEEDFEEVLRQLFPGDDIQSVAKGKRGADIIHTIRDDSRQACGLIVWEIKNTNNWSAGWVDKLKIDQRESQAETAVLVTRALPDDIPSFGFKDGVWVADFAAARALAVVLRRYGLELAHTRRSAVGRQDKMGRLYDYLVSPHFRQAMQSIIETYSGMKNQLEKEKAAMLKLWAQREKQIETMTCSTAGMYGDLQGIIGGTLPDIPALELSAAPVNQLLPGAVTP